MDFTFVLCGIAVLYGVLLFFDLFFKSCMLKPYICFLKGTGISIKFFQIKWETTIFNRLFLRWANTPTQWSIWFTWGMYLTLLILPVSVLLLIIALSQNFISTNVAGVYKSSNLVIEPLIPGLNLPASEIGYYSLSLILCSIIHELGHAISSVQEDVHIINVGINILYILPVAYVNLSSERLNALNPWRALRILCAGIWHNLVLSMIAYLLYCSLPYVYTIAFNLNQGIIVTAMKENSPLMGSRGLEVHNIITKINLCEIKNEADFYNCLHRAYVDKRGYCVHADMVHDLDESIPLKYTSNGLDCCDEEKTDNLCFEYVDHNDGVLEIPPHVCLPARTVVETATLTCGGVSNIECSNKLHCIKPMLDNVTTLIKIMRENRPDVIYIGHPGDLIQTITVSSFIPKHWTSTLLFPDIVMKFLEYIIVISTGLALINVIPCLFMDGQHITNCLVDILMTNTPREKARMVATFICLCSTVILLFHCFYTIWLKLV